MTVAEFHEHISSAAFVEAFSDTEGLCLFTLLHMAPITVPPGFFDGAPHITRVESITQRHAADCVASLVKRRETERAHYLYWYYKWSSSFGGYNIPDELLPICDEMRSRIEAANPGVRIGALEV